MTPNESSVITCRDQYKASLPLQKAIIVYLDDVAVEA